MSQLGNKVGFIGKVSDDELGNKYVNEPDLWLETENWVREALIEGNIDFVEVPGEAAFYGPKIDVQVWSAIGKEFTLATNQVDFAVPSKFGPEIGGGVAGGYIAKQIGGMGMLSKAGGGIAGLSGGIDMGPQRRSMNPDSQGLQGLMKRGIKT